MLENTSAALQTMDMLVTIPVFFVNYFTPLNAELIKKPTVIISF
jgi:hypothetical protein